MVLLGGFGSIGHVTSDHFSEYGIFTHHEGGAVMWYWWVDSGLLDMQHLDLNYKMDRFSEYEIFTHCEGGGVKRY